MMKNSSDPYIVLGIAPESDDDTIRKRYLELIKQYTPEQCPKEFNIIREAYDKLRDLDRRVSYRLFEQGKQESLDEVIEELACQTTRRRFSLQTLLRAKNQS
jgi:curved DNA-binding protein CbpA